MHIDVICALLCQPRGSTIRGVCPLSQIPRGHIDTQQTSPSLTYKNQEVLSNLTDFLFYIYSDSKKVPLDIVYILLSLKRKIQEVSSHLMNVLFTYHCRRPHVPPLFNTRRGHTRLPCLTHTNILQLAKDVEYVVQDSPDKHMSFLPGR